jgi:lipoprotein NlpD
MGRRVGRPAGARAWALLAVALLGVQASGSGCAGHSPSRSEVRARSGFHHEVQAGENLYRIGLRYGVDARTLARVNGIDDVTQLHIGQRLWIPGTGAAARQPLATATPGRSGAPADVRQEARRQAREAARLAFVWPVEGTITSRFGRRGRDQHEGVDVAARRGTPIRAAEAGKVIHSGPLGAYGQVVIVKHSGHYRTVYAHARRLHVHKGQFVDRGQEIAEIGSTGNASGPHVHFEIRERDTARDPLLYLP